MADLSRAMELSTTQDWMAVSSYGSGTTSSGVVRILKDRDSDLDGRHVLIVEDDPHVRQLLCQALRENGFPCQSAADANEGLKVLVIEKTDMYGGTTAFSGG